MAERIPRDGVRLAQRECRWFSAMPVRSQQVAGSSPVPRLQVLADAWSSTPTHWCPQYDPLPSFAGPLPSARAPVAERPARATVIAEPARTRERSQRPLRERQPSLALGDSYTLPSVDLLNPPPPATNVAIDLGLAVRRRRGE